MDQIKRIMRPTDVPDTGLLCDLLWSDPDKDIGECCSVLCWLLPRRISCRRHPLPRAALTQYLSNNPPIHSTSLSVVGWGENDRGVSFTFGPDVVAAFLKRHDLDLICRAHQVVEDGYEFFAKRQLVTLFSAPNYCGEFDNAGAMMSVDDTLMCSFQILKPAEKKTKGEGTRGVWVRGSLWIGCSVRSGGRGQVSCAPSPATSSTAFHSF